MSKALMEKAFEKWWYLKYKDLMIEYDYIKDLGERKLKVNYWHSYCRQAFIAGATWQREQLDRYKAKDLLDEIHTSYMRYHAENYDTKDFVINVAGGSVVVMDKQGYQELKTAREQLEAEIKEQVIKKAELFVECGKRGEQISDLQAENKTIRQQLIKELREWIESNKELRGYTGIPDDTLNIILAKLDLLEKGGK
jgi:predicted XRE-type DNA-binding protein